MAQFAALLPIGGAASADITSANAIAGRLTEMVPQHPRHAAEMLSQCVVEARALKGHLRRQLKLLDQIHHHAESVVTDLDKMLDESRLPLTATSRIAAATADRLLKQLGEAYMELALELNSKWLRAVYRSALEQACFRAAQLIHKRSLMALRAYASGSSRRWAQFNSIYGIAREGGFHRKSFEGEETIERLVGKSGLLALADPATLGAEELGWLRFYVERHGNRVVVRSAPPEKRGAGLFVLTEKGRVPRRLGSSYELNPGELVLDLRTVLKHLKRQLVGMRTGIPPNKLGLPLAAAKPEYMFLLQRCGEQWSEPRARRHSRNSFRPRADLVPGFDSVRHFLTAAAFRRRATDKSEGIGGGLSQSSEWQVVDQSPSGFGLRFVSGHAGAIAVGELVALRPRESAAVSLCVTRRARSITNADFELGVELLGDNAAPASINKPTTKGKSVQVPALLLSKVLCLNKSPGLLAPIGDVTPGMSLMVPYKGAMVQLEAVEIVERLASCDLIRLRARRVGGNGETVDIDDELSDGKANNG
ncbi:MAG: hypothetical protein REI94_11135 [Moraxellaceae bacterium]|nr:hypothetical protein [Moraxellaceae bacterium]